MPDAKALSNRPLWQRLLWRRLKFLLVLVMLLAVLLGGSYLFAPQWLMQADSTRKAMSAQLEKHSVQVGDTRWSYYEGGTGQTMVFLHGFGSRKELWLDMMKPLTAHFHVIIPDLPGWGESTRVPGASYNIDAQVARLDGFAQSLNLSKFMLVGHSMGGAIAGVYAAQHPDRVASLALLDSFGLNFTPNAFAKQAMAGHNPFDFDDKGGFERVLAQVFAKPPQIPGRFIDVLIQQNQRDRAFIDNTFNELRQPGQYLSLQDRLGQLTMPVLGLWCKDDKVIDISAQEQLRQNLVHTPSISTSTLLGCNHMPMVEKPDDTARILTSFALSH